MSDADPPSDRGLRGGERPVQGGGSVSEAALAPKVGPLSHEEIVAVNAATGDWFKSLARDPGLWKSITESEDVYPHRWAVYIMIRARRAGVPLEKLL